MKKIIIALVASVGMWLFSSAPASAQPQPAAPYVIMVCNINGALYNIDQNYGIFAPNGFYMGQLVAAATPSGWIAVRTDGAQFPVFGCR